MTSSSNRLTPRQTDLLHQAVRRLNPMILAGADGSRVACPVTPAGMAVLAELARRDVEQVLGIPPDPTQDWMTAP
jgi:hypothetical protein